MNGERGRWSAKAKREAVLRLLRGEAIDALSRELTQLAQFEAHSRLFREVGFN